MAEKLRTSFAEIEAQKAAAEAQSEAAERSRQAAEEATVRAERAKQEGMAEAADRLEDLADSVARAGNALTDRVAQVNRGTSRQHDRTTETATAMDEMNATVREVAQNASQASESANATRERAQEGLAATEEVSRSIDRVRELSEGLKVSLDALGVQAKGISAIMSSTTISISGSVTSASGSVVTVVPGPSVAARGLARSRTNTVLTVMARPSRRSIHSALRSRIVTRPDPTVPNPANPIRTGELLTTCIQKVPFCGNSFYRGGNISAWPALCKALISAGK